jgi:hypothetical protein
MGLERRLRKLEGTPAHQFEDWPVSDQIEAVAFQIHQVPNFHQHHNPEHKYFCTDRELRIAQYVAEYVEARREGEAPPSEAGFDPARYAAKVPLMFAEYLERWDAWNTGESQLERDAWLYHHRHRSKEHRQKVAEMHKRKQGGK